MNPLVSVSWLAEHINDPQTVVLDATLPPVGVVPPVDTRGRSLERHLPGAVFFDIDELSDHSTSLPHMLPSEEEFSRKMGELGVGDGMTIVIYEQTGVFSAPRAWWMLRSFGAEKVHVLDGGLDAWIAAGLPVEAGPVKRAEEKFSARLDESVVKSFEDVQGMIADKAQILDARSAGRFAGTAPEPRPGISSGHMPGATSVPFLELTEEGRMKSAEGLREVLAAKKVDLKRPITTTCGSGVTAAVIALGLEIAGASQVSLYDGSWAEYAQRPEAVIEKDGQDS
jgi:thiosulfate/3-mercaptopyruvate sulfurtransferase